MGRSRLTTTCVGLLFPCLALTAVAFFAVAIILAALFPVFIREQVNKKVTVLPGHATYEQLQHPSVPLWKTVYFLNLTNPEEFKNGAKPVVNATGPYSYSENRTKFFQGVSDDNTQLTYNQSKVFHFDPTTSGKGLQESDIICTINLPLVGAVAELDRMSPILKEAGKYVLKDIFDKTKSQIYMCEEATPLIWNFTNSLVHELHTSLPLKLVKANYPRDWVAIQYNNSQNDSQPSTIYTGVDDINRIGQFVRWDGHTQLDTWPNGMGANDINGTEGLFFRPSLREEEGLEGFVDDVLRSFPLVYSGKVKHLGLQAYRYELPLTVFKSAFNYPENARWGSWNPDGLFYLGPTQYPEVPVYGSKPHFLDGAPILREKVAGLHPDRALHDTTIDVEPFTGANLQFKRQLQVNVQVNQTTDFSQLEKINGTVYFPILYINEHSELTPSMKKYLEDKGLREIYLGKTLVWVAFAVLLFLGLIVGVLSIVVFVVFVKRIRRQHNQEETTPLLK